MIVLRRARIAWNQRPIVMSHLLQGEDACDGRRQSPPLVGFLLQIPAASAGERIELCAASQFAGLPFGGDPAGQFELVERGVERAVADLQVVVRDLFEPLADGPAVQWFKGEDLEQQKVERALKEIG